MGYDWKGWSILLYVLGATYTAFQLANPAELGMSPIVYKWVLFAFGIATTVAAKFGASWAGKSNGDLKVDPSVFRVLLPFIVFIGMVNFACAPPKTIETEPGKRAWYAAQVLQRIEEVQNITIALSKSNPPAIKVETARVIVQFCVTSAKIVGDMPEGYPKVILTAFNELKTKLPPEVASNPTLVTSLAILEGILTTLAGGLS